MKSRFSKRWYHQLRLHSQDHPVNALHKDHGHHRLICDFIDGTYY